MTKVAKCSWSEFSAENQRKIECARRFGFLHGPLLSALRFWNRLHGKYSRADQIALACVCEPPPFFLEHGVMIPHPFGVTLSVDQMGADCLIGQNVTIGTDAREMQVGENTDGHKPRLGHLVRIYANSVVSGRITIGDCVIVAAQSFVNRDVPSFSIVYGKNNIFPLQPAHYKLLRMTLHFAINNYRLVPGLAFSAGKMYIDPAYASLRNSLLSDLGLLSERSAAGRLL